MFSERASRCRVSRPSLAIDMMPVSSDTISDTASVVSVMPMAARWRVPRSRLMVGSSESGSMQAAALMRRLRSIIAPSCSGVLGSNMFSISGALISASTRVPVSITSPRPVCRSMTISAPIFLRAMSFIARMISVTGRSTCSSGVLPEEPNTLRISFDRPNWSSPRRNSGWNSITMTSRPMLMTWLSSHDTALKRSTLESHAMTSTMAMPLNRELDRVWSTSLMTL